MAKRDFKTKGFPWDSQRFPDPQWFSVAIQESIDDRHGFMASDAFVMASEGAIRCDLMPDMPGWFIEVSPARNVGYADFDSDRNVSYRIEFEEAKVCKRKADNFPRFTRAPGKSNSKDAGVDVPPMREMRDDEKWRVSCLHTVQ